MAGERASADTRLSDLLSNVFGEMDEHGIGYCVFRGYCELGVWDHEKEIDLLVEPADLGKLRSVLKRLNFVEVPSWGHDPHKFFVAYVRELGGWLKLDVVTAVRFGKPISSLELAVVQDVIARRVRRSIGFEISPDYEFLILLLKCMLNEADIEHRRWQRLSELSLQLQALHSADGSLDTRLRNLFDNELSLSELLELCEARDWPAIYGRRQRLINKLKRSQPLGTALRHLKISVLKRLSPLLRTFRPGVSVALLAPDGAGKSTLARALLSQRYLRARLIYMGQNAEASNINLPTSAWLRRNRALASKRSPRRLVARLLSFPNSFLDQLYRRAVGAYLAMRGHTVVYDRFVYDSWINPPASGLKGKFRRFLIEHSCPGPDLVFLLDAPGRMLFSRKGEHDPAALEGKRVAYLGLRDRLKNLVVIDATKNAEAVQREAISTLWTFYCERNISRVIDGRSK